MKKSFKRQKGQAMVEYGIIVALVALVGMMSLQMLGGNLSGVFQSANQSLGGDESVPGGNVSSASMIDEGFDPPSSPSKG